MSDPPIEIYDEKERLILAAAENLLRECAERVRAIEWEKMPRSTVIGLGETRGKAEIARQALALVRIHLQVYYAPAPAPVPEPASLRVPEAS
jgi:hypothetical protein